MLSPRNKKTRNAWTLTAQRSELFHRDILPIIDQIPKIEWNQEDVKWLWDDIKISFNWYKLPKWALEPEEMKETTDDILKIHYKELCKEYPLEISSRLLQWYSYFDNLGVYKLEMPSERDYDYFFRLKASGDIDKYARLRHIMFHRFVHRLFSKQAEVYRCELLKEILNKPENILSLIQKSYVLPIEYQFFLTTSKVYGQFRKNKEHYLPILFKTL